MRVGKDTKLERCTVASSKLAASGGIDEHIRLWSLQPAKGYRSQTVTFDRAHRGSVECICAGAHGAHGNASGAVLFSGGRDAQICAWDPASSSPVVSFRGHRDAVRVVRSSSR